MKQTIAILAALLALSSLAQSVRFRIDVAVNGITNNAVVNITNRTQVAGIVAFATNANPDTANAAVAVKQWLRSAVRDAINGNADNEDQRALNEFQAALESHATNRVSKAEDIGP